MSVDRWLGIFGAVTGALGLFLAYFYYRKSIRTKVLAIAYSKPIPLLIPVKDVEVHYLGKRHSNLSRTFVLFWNKGTSAIESTDFIRPISLNNSEKIVQTKIYEKDVTADVAVNESGNGISINLLRPGESFIIQTDGAEDEFRPDVQVQMKSSDMSTFISGMVLSHSKIIGMMVSIAVSIYLFFIADKPFELFLSRPENTSLFILSVIAELILIFAAIIGSGLGTTWSLQKIFKSFTPPLVWRFFQIQETVESALTLWLSIKKTIAAVAK